MDADEARFSLEKHRAWLEEEMRATLRREADFRRAAEDQKAHYARLVVAVAAIDRAADALVRDPRQGGAADGMEVAS